MRYVIRKVRIDMSLKASPVPHSPLAVPLLPVIAKLRHSHNMFDREIVSRTIVVAFYVANLLEAPLQVALAIGKLPFTAVKIILGSAAPMGIALGAGELRQVALLMGAILFVMPESMHESLGMKKVGVHLRRAALCVVVVGLDSLRAIVNPDKLVDLCVIRGICVRSGITSRVKEFIRHHRKELFFAAGGILVGFAVCAIATNLRIFMPVTPPDSSWTWSNRVWSLMSGSSFNPSVIIVPLSAIALIYLNMMRKSILIAVKSKPESDLIDSSKMPKTVPVEIVLPPLPLQDSNNAGVSPPLLTERRPSLGIRHLTNKTDNSKTISVLPLSEPTSIVANAPLIVSSEKARILARQENSLTSNQQRQST